MSDWWLWGLGAGLVWLVAHRLRIGTTALVPKPAAAPLQGDAMSNETTIYYRTKDGLADYGFAFSRMSAGFYRVYIVSQPSYGFRDTSVHATHRLTDGDRRYICWTGVLRTEEQARAVAAAWADRTQEYIVSGKSF